MSRIFITDSLILQLQFDVFFANGTLTIAME